MLHRAKHPSFRQLHHQVQRLGNAGQERVRGRILPGLLKLPQLHVEHPVVQGEGEVPERAETEARARVQEEAFTERNNGVEGELERRKDAEVLHSSSRGFGILRSLVFQLVFDKGI